MFCLHACQCTMCVPDAGGGHKKVLEVDGCELHVGAGKQRQILGKDSKCS